MVYIYKTSTVGTQRKEYRAINNPSNHCSYISAMHALAFTDYRKLIAKREQTDLITSIDNVLRSVETGDKSINKHYKNHLKQLRSYKKMKGDVTSAQLPNEGMYFSTFFTFMISELGGIKLDKIIDLGESDNPENNKATILTMPLMGKYGHTATLVNNNDGSYTYMTFGKVRIK